MSDNIEILSQSSIDSKIIVLYAFILLIKEHFCHADINITLTA